MIKILFKIINRKQGETKSNFVQHEISVTLSYKH